MVRDLLAGSLELGTSRWPEDLSGLLDRRGFIEEVRRLLARVRQLGLDPVDLAELARAEGRADWAAAAAFCEEYLDVLDLRGVLDYGELVRSAAALAADPSVRAELRSAYDVVLVDEYQDTDPAQEQLLREIAGDGRELVVVGDPDQSIYGFRGAEISNILQFPDRFRTATGKPAGVRVLQTSRRATGELLERSRGIATRIPLPGLPVESVRRHRDLASVDPAAPLHEPEASRIVTTGQLSLLDDPASPQPPEQVAADDPGPAPQIDPVGSSGAVSALVFPTVGAEVEAIADVLRRAHLEDGVAWSSMAVLVRSGMRSIPTLRRALGTAGVPVDVAGDEVPLVREPAVRTLLLALAAAVVPGRLTAEAVRDLLGSPLVATSPARLRKLGRALRALDRARVTDEGTMPRPSGELLLAAALDRMVLDTVPEDVARPLLRLHDLLDRVRDTHAAGGTVEDSLWSLWSATRWPRRLEEASYAGGAAGRRADADLDAVVALFDIAARAEERLGRVGIADFVEQVQAQQIPADTLAEQAVRHDAVRLLTAHRSKGLEWDLVVVAGVQEEVWPDLRRRDSLLGAERVGRLDSGEPMAADPPGLATVVVDERRLFYVAITRARRRLVVTAVASPDDGGERPSRFLAELGLPIEEAGDRPRRRLAITDLVADLRATAIDPAVPPALRAAATRRLAHLAGARAPGGRQLVPSADPAGWWGLADETVGDPMRADGQPIRLSGSALEQLGTCPLQWFLDKEARGSAGSGRAAGFGSIVHALAEAVTRGTLEPDLDTLAERVDRVWARLEFEIPWHSERERSQARAALSRFLEWHTAERGRTAAVAERSMRFRLEVAGQPVEIRGRLDRVELDADGRVWVVDFKTTKTPRTQDRVDNDPQLAVYQMAVRAGALGELAGGADPAEPAGAELVYLRADAARGAGGPKIIRQAALGPPGTHPAEDTLETAVRRIAAERFPAVVGPQCQYCVFKRSCPADPYGQQVVS